MKKVIKCSDISNKGRNWLSSDEVNSLIKGCTAREKRLIGKIANSRRPAEYLWAMIDTIEMLESSISDSFDNFLSRAAEVLQ